MDTGNTIEGNKLIAVFNGDYAPSYTIVDYGGGNRGISFIIRLMNSNTIYHGIG